MTRVRWAVALLLVLAPICAQEPVGLAQGVSVKLVLGPGAGWRGALLPVQADWTDSPGTILLWHDGRLGPAAGRQAVALARVLSRGVAGEAGRAAFEQAGLRLRFPALTEPLDGGSCGVSMAVAAVSRLLDVPASPEVVFTGAVDEQGQVQPVTGLPYKLRAALEHGYRTFVMPLRNAREVMAADPLATASRIRIVGVESLWQALLEAYGAAGPDGEVWRDYQQLYQHGLRLLATSESAPAADCFAACLSLQPGDLAAEFWLAECRRQPLDSLAQAAAWQHLQQFGEAAREAMLAEASGPDPYRIDRFLIRARQAARVAARRRLVDEALRRALDGRFAAALGLLDQAAAQADDAAARAEVRRARTAVELRQSQAALLSGDTAAADWLALCRRAMGLADWDLLLDIAAHGTAAHDDPRLAAYEAEALLKLGDTALAQSVLERNLAAWPGHLPSRLRLLDLGVDRLPPRAWIEDRRYGSLLLADPPGAEVGLLLAGLRVATGTAPWPLPTPGPGAQRRAAMVSDNAGNAALTERVNGRPSPDAALRPGIVPSSPPCEVPLIAAGTWLLRPEDLPVVWPAALLSPLVAAAGRDAATLRVGLAAPFTGGGLDEPLPLAPDWSRGVVSYELWGQWPDGPGLGPAELKLVRTTALLAAVDQAAVTVGRPIPVIVAAGFAPVWARMVSAGRVFAEGPAGELRLPPGVERFGLVLTDAEQRHTATAPVTL